MTADNRPGQDLTPQERIYKVPPERRDWVIRARTAVLQASEKLGPIKLSPWQRLRGSKMDVPDILEGVRKSDSPILTSLVLELMTDEEFEKWVNKYALKQPTRLEVARKFVTTLAAKVVLV